MPINAMQADLTKGGAVHMTIGPEDEFVTDEHRLEAVMAFIDITNNLFRYLDGWIFTKANPDVVDKARRPHA